MPIGTRTIRAPRGSALSCKGWAQEAALRMLMNNLDPDVAQRLRERDPDEYIEQSRRSMARHVEAMLALQQRGAVTFARHSPMRA